MSSRRRRNKQKQSRRNARTPWKEGDFLKEPRPCENINSESYYRREEINEVKNKKKQFEKNVNKYIESLKLEESQSEEEIDN